MYQTEFAKVEYLENLNIVLVTWKKFCMNDDYRNVLREAIRVISKHSDCHYAADTRTGFENDPEDTAWVCNVFAPEAYAAGCRHIFFIVDCDNLLKDELDSQTDELQKYFRMHTCLELESISKILEEYKECNI